MPRGFEMARQTDFLKVKKKVKQKDWLTLKEIGMETLKDFQMEKLTQRDSVKAKPKVIQKG